MINFSELPLGWSLTSLGELVISISYGYTASATDHPVGPKFLRITDLQNNSVNWDTVPFCNCDQVDKYKLKKGDIVVARTGATTGKSFLLNDLPKHTVFASYLIRLHTSSFCPPEYLSLFMQSIDYWNQITVVSKGTAQPGANASILSTLSIPLPPLNEQRRIVAEIEALKARSQQVKEALEAILPLLDQFRQSVLAAAFRGDLTADWRRQDDAEFLDYNFPSTWKKEQLGNVLEELKQGWSPKCENFPSPCDDIWGVIKTTAVQSLRFIEGENKQLPSYLEPRPELELLEGDLLITRAGPRARAGITCLVPSVRPKLMVCDKVYRLRVKESYILPLYLAYFLNSASTISLIDELKTGISDSGVNLTQEKFLAILLWFPPIAEQKKIVSRIKTLLKIADEIEQQYQQAKVYLDQLNQSILAKAFRGELVPQDPNDEPASVLLERIRAEREKREAEAKTAKKSTGKSTGQRSKKAKQQDSESIQL